MTDEQIRDAGAAAVADFPPMPDEVAAQVGHMLALVAESPEPKPSTTQHERAA